MPFVVVYDASVFYPDALRDLHIRVAGAGLFQAKWTRQIVAEAMTALARNRPDIPAARLERLGALINDSVPDCLITGYEPLVAWDRDWTGKVIPNLAEEFSGNADATEFTFKLRKGLKWSDGQPFTSDDIGFFVNDIAQNKDLFPTPPDWLTVDGKVGEFPVLRKYLDGWTEFPSP